MTFAEFMAAMQPIILAILTAVSLLIAGMIKVYVPKAIAAFERRTGIQLTDQQRAAVRASADTQAGILETMLQQGAIKLSQVTPTDPAIIRQAQAAIARVPDSAAAQGTSVPAMAAIIVGKTDTAPQPPVVVLPLQAGASA